MTWNPDDELIAFMNSLIDSSDTLLLGRKTADSIIMTAKLDTAHLRLNNSPAANNRIAERWADGRLVSTYVFQFSCISSSTL